MIGITELITGVNAIRERLRAAQENSKTAADINTVMAVLLPTLQNLEASPDLQDRHIQNGLGDLKVFLERDLDTLSRELAEQWDFTRFMCATGNEDRMKAALGRLNNILNALDSAVSAAFQQAGRRRDETLMQQNVELKVRECLQCMSE